MIIAFLYCIIISGGVCIIISGGVLMIDLSTPDTLLYDSAVLSSYIRKNTKESFGYIFLIISIILLSFTMTIECVM